MQSIQELLERIHTELSPRFGDGKVASYIPELSKVSPEKFAMAIALPNGEVFTCGQSEEAFSIQSISKVFSLTLALGKVGEKVWARVGKEPSGSAFNSIVQLEHEKGIPRNPFINAGAIVIADLIANGHEPSEAIGEILQFIRFLASDENIHIDKSVAASETAHGHRNAALAEFMASFGNLNLPSDKVRGVYFHQCAIAMNCRQLAKAGLFLANGGRVPGSDNRVVTSQRARRIIALMLTCGHYDGSGEFAFRVGIPGKSGVGGGILAVSPGKGSVAVWSPGLNSVGNSLLGTEALELLSKYTDWSIFYE
ncbi:MAG: glutaminase [Salaquimonas sp.]